MLHAVKYEEDLSNEGEFSVKKEILDADRETKTDHDFPNLGTSQERLKQTIIFPILQFKCGNSPRETETDPNVPNFTIYMWKLPRETETDHNFTSFTI